MMFATLLVALLAADPADASASTENKEGARRVLELAKQYEFYGDAQLKTKLDMDAKPLLVYSNPVRGEVYGNIFVWTLRGRPALIGAFFDHRSEERLTSELHMLSKAGFVGRRGGETFWSPQRPGVAFEPVEDAPAPAASEAGRGRQMRDLAKRFTVERDHPEQGKGEVRLLTQPIYRYSAKPDGIVDGAIFAFVEGTDPETFLLLEAAPADKPQWRFAFARMNIVPFTASLDGEQVWHVDDVSWDTVFDKQEPYAIVWESPLRGLKRTK
jgi:hypothetical protein